MARKQFAPALKRQIIAEYRSLGRGSRCAVAAKHGIRPETLSVWACSADTLRPGDVVRHRAGGTHDMCVESIGDDNQITVTWMEGGELRRETLDAATVMRVEK